MIIDLSKQLLHSLGLRDLIKVDASIGGLEKTSQHLHCNTRLVLDPSIDRFYSFLGTAMQITV